MINNPEILMIEHDEDDRQLTQGIFADKGYGINIKFLGQSTEVFTWLATCEANHKLPDLILLSVKLTPTDGITLLKDLKSDERYKAIPVVMLSDSAHPAEVQRCYQYGANSFIQKPFTGDGTFKAIDSFINYWFDTIELPASTRTPA